MRRYKGASSDTPIPGEGKGLMPSRVPAILWSTIPAICLVSNLGPGGQPAMSPSGAPRNANLQLSPPAPQPPPPLSPQARTQEQGDWDDYSFATTKLLGVLVPSTGRAVVEITFAASSRLLRVRSVAWQRRRRPSSCLHSVQTLVDASDYPVG